MLPHAPLGASRAATVFSPAQHRRCRLRLVLGSVLGVAFRARRLLHPLWSCAWPPGCSRTGLKGSVLSNHLLESTTTKAPAMSGAFWELEIACRTPPSHGLSEGVDVHALPLPYCETRLTRNIERQSRRKSWDNPPFEPAIQCTFIRSQATTVGLMTLVN